MAKPAASTAADQVRLPLDNWFMARVIERSLVSSALLAYIDWTLVLITEDMVFLLNYLSSDNTACGAWLAWAIMAVAACWMIWVRANSALDLA